MTQINKIQNIYIHSDEGLTLETSASESLYGNKTKLSCNTLTDTALYTLVSLD